MTDMLYAPWREEFILGPKEEGCIFCQPGKRKGVREFILHKSRRAFVVMNRYPYNSGHLMVVPNRHLAQLEELSSAERNELMSLVALSSRVLNETIKPEGLNLGMNLGRAAGAGIAGHLHIHLVPRWVGDTNFMPVLFDTRVVSVDTIKLCRKLKAAFRKSA
ncbi:MAG: HIT domain-containing protein [candidate division Zixibacteria bacterium]|nr:HIT domain-containing protein [candidate division Zixibacteria bacterium]